MYKEISGVQGNNGMQQDVERFKEELNSHFVEEIKNKKRMHELEQKMETTSLNIIGKMNEHSLVSKDKGRESISAKLLEDELEESN